MGIKISYRIVKKKTNKQTKQSMSALDGPNAPDSECNIFNQ